MKLQELCCPNCNGKLEIAKGKVVCPYCASVLLLEDGMVEEETEEPVALLTLYVDESKLLKDEKVWNSLCESLENGYSFEDYVKLFELIAKDSYNCTTPKKNDKLYQKISQRIAPYLKNDDSLLLFCDEGISAGAKNGYALTKYNIFFCKKDKTTQLPIKEVKSLTRTLLNNGWCFNENEDTKVSKVPVTSKQLGLIISYVVSTARKLNGDSYSIDVYSE